ncbi:hypothetical protein JKF63_03396 [Porcisia hertigi]|uniref:Guanine nucleotide-binding protein subunit beta-like protein n=1 Tax=Porcisia hertigi TaxID=2761500 RepID=A0A836IN18_9TRYP|nr:hypothetical protein JKF63_03396 [Porcisia hertigi]
MESKRTLAKRYVFGTNHDGKNCLHWLDDGSLVYPVGKTVVLQQPNSCTQRFLEATYQSTGITAIAMSSNKKFLAIAESGTHPQVQIIDTVTRKRRKVLSVTDLNSDQFIALSFSSDGRHLVTQGGAPGWNLHYWNWERTQPLASVSLGPVYAASMQSHKTSQGGPSGENAVPADSSVTHEEGVTDTLKAASMMAAPSASAASRTPPKIVTSIGISPLNPLMITVAGVGFFRFYRYTEGLLQPQPSLGVPCEQLEVFSTHLWVTEHNVILATQSGRLFLIQDGRYVGPIGMPSIPSPALVSAVSAPLQPGGAPAAPVEEMVTCIAPTYHQEQQQQQQQKPAQHQSGFIAGTNRGNVLIFQGDGNAAGADGVAAGLRGDSAGVDSVGYAFVCRLEVPAYEAGEEQHLLQASQQASIIRNSPGSVSTALPSGTVSATGKGSSVKGHAGRLFQLREQTSGAEATGGGAAGNRVQNAAGDLSLMKAGTDGGGSASGGSARNSVTALALDQAEECLAVFTASGRLYGLDFRQNWPAREAMFMVTGRSATTSGTAIGAGSGEVPGLSGPLPSLIEHGNSECGWAMSSAPVPEHLSPRSALFHSLYPFTHSGRVNGMDCSVRKPLLLTTGSDHSMRLWNIHTGRLLMCQFFALEPGAVALHPDGLTAVVCFPDKVRVMSVLWSSFRERRVINLRNASDVFFSKGGQLLAVVHNNLVDIINANTYELQGQLRGHPQRIKDFQWCSTTAYPTDNRVMTCSPDGMILDWSVTDMRKQTEHSDRRYQYVAIASDDRSVWAVAAPTPATALDVSWKVLLREIDRQSLSTIHASPGIAGAAPGGGGVMSSSAGGPSGGASALGNSVGDYEFTETALTRIVVAPHQRVLIGGAEDGSLKAMTFPLLAGIQEAPIAAHAQQVTHMALSFDETMLFTAGADGSVIMWEVFSEKDKGKPAGTVAQHHDPASRRNMSSTEEVLVTRQEIEEQNIEIDSLRQQIERLKTEMESDEKRRAHEQGTRTRERVEELQQEAMSLSAEYEALKHAKADQERAFLDAKEEKTRDASHIQQNLETQRQQEVDALTEECSALQHRLETTKTAGAAAVNALRVSLAQACAEDEAHFQDVLRQRAEAVRKLQRQLEQSKESNSVTLHQLELDTDAESQAVLQKQRAALQEVRERFLHLKGEGAVMRKNAMRLEREIEIRTNELQLLDGAKVALQNQLADLTQQVAQLHQDIDERDSVTEKKEKVIYNLKKHNQELEKHKYVLDHQIRELKGQIEPKQREIIELNQETKQQNAMLEQQHASNLTLRQSTEDLKRDIAEKQRTLQARIRELQGLETYRSRAERDIGELAHQLQHPATLAAAVEQLYKVHVEPRDVEQIAPADPNVKHELQSQLEYLSTSVDALRRKLKSDQQRHKEEVSAMMTENLSLIREIHSLRVEMDNLRARVAAESVSKQHQQHHQRRRRTGGARAERSAGLTSAERSSTADVCVTDTLGTISADNVGQSTQLLSSELESTRGGSGTRRRGGRSSSAGSRPSTSLPEIETNSRELRMLRAYIEKLELALAERPASAAVAKAHLRLPPVDPFSIPR